MSQNTPSDGRVRAITRWGTPILHSPLREVTSKDFNSPELDALIADMFATMYAAQGAGLAANQVGVNQKVFVYDVTSAGHRTHGVVCNPVVETVDVDSTKEHQAVQRTQALEEGCLSYPGFCTSVTRPRAIVLRGVDRKGLPIEIHAQELLAQILQHETDHLNGVVYGDHVSRELRDKMDKKYESLQAVSAYPEDWPVSQSYHMWATLR
jgi:peptide deformylase